jgi:hypothetical protein
MLDQEERERLRWEGSVAKSISTLERSVVTIEKRGATKDDVRSAMDKADAACSLAAAAEKMSDVRCDELREDFRRAIDSSAHDVRGHVDQRLADLGLKEIGVRLVRVEADVSTLKKLTFGSVLKYGGLGAGGAAVLWVLAWAIKWAVTGDPSLTWWE